MQEEGGAWLMTGARYAGGRRRSLTNDKRDVCMRKEELD